MRCIMGLDIGSVTVKVALISENNKVLKTFYERSQGKPLEKLRSIFNKIPKGYKVIGVGVTGSARTFIGKVVGADLVKNEITAHAAALSKFYPEARTVFEIGGQDSKIIIFRKGVPVDFAMNTVCAAGTGSFLDQQAGRLCIPIEDFGKIALKSKKAIEVGGRCTVFAESDMVQKQQAGHKVEDIIKGLCSNLVKNYLNNVAKGKDLEEPFVLLGGVASNKGIVKAFEEQLNTKIIIPEHYKVMGAIGMALLVIRNLPQKTKFRGLEFRKYKLKREAFQCQDCVNKCDIIRIGICGEISHIGSKCGKWE